MANSAALSLRGRMRGFMRTAFGGSAPAASQPASALPPVRVAPTLYPPRPARVGAHKRAYAGAQHSRLTADWMALSTSFDAELRGSLRTLRNRSRSLRRDNDFAKNMVRVITKNVIGKGIQYQGRVLKRGGKLHDAVNPLIEEQWKAWSKARRCHVSGRLSLNELQRLIMSHVVVDGEVLVRLVPQAFGDSKVPLGLEVIEADQLADEYNGTAPGTGNQVRMGVEVDEWHRPLAYWLYRTHPGDYQFAITAESASKLRRIPADEIIHLFVTERTGGTRGEPWMHTTIRSLRDVNGAIEAEIVAMRGAACTMGFVTRAEDADPSDPLNPHADAMGSDDVVGGQKVYDFEPGLIKELEPGQDFKGFAPTRPNTALDPFTRFLIRKACAGVGASYEATTRDYSQTTYSSGRLALLDDRDLWQILQQWFSEHFLQIVHERWLAMAVLVGLFAWPDFETNPDRYTEARWRARGWDWVDPQKDIAASKEAIKAGLATRTSVLAQKGEDTEDIDDERRRELDYQEDLDLRYDVDPGAGVAASPSGDEADDGEQGGEGDRPSGAKEGAADPAGGVDPKTTDGAPPKADGKPKGSKARAPVLTLPTIHIHIDGRSGAMRFVTDERGEIVGTEPVAA